MASAAQPAEKIPHVPVLLRPLLRAVEPIKGVWIDGTLGAGGYTRALLEAGAEKVIAIDRDPTAHDMAKRWMGDYAQRLALVQANFSEMDAHVEAVDGVVLDLGVSSMQLDQAGRGFSFMKDGPLDMRMSQQGPSAADLVHNSAEADIADILFLFGEERASRRIARAIIKAREASRIDTTLELADIIERCLPRVKPGQAHPATRSFQALRIAVNDEYGALVDGLEAAERVLRPGGQLAVVTFHSIEDRIVKRFLQLRSDKGGGGSRYAPAHVERAPQFHIKTRKSIGPDDLELKENPRSRSARLRVAMRTDAPSGPVDRKALGMPQLKRR